MRSIANRWRWMRLMAASAGVTVLGGCGLSDAQLTQILQTVISTGLNTLLSQAISALFAGATGTA